MPARAATPRGRCRRPGSRLISHHCNEHGECLEKLGREQAALETPRPRRSGSERSFVSFCCSFEALSRRTSLLAEFGRRGHAVVKELGRRIVKEEQKSDRRCPRGSEKTAWLARSGRRQQLAAEDQAAGERLRLLVIDLCSPSPARSMIVATCRTVVDGEFELPP
jgi:hypothetical protein